MICGDLLWISISVTRGKLVDLVLVRSDYYIKTHYFFWCSTSEGIQSLKGFYEYIFSVLDREVRGSILVEANLFLAIKLQPDLIIRAILQVASILWSKLKLK